jgi:hypothetical protein
MKFTVNKTELNYYGFFQNRLYVCVVLSEPEAENKCFFNFESGRNLSCVKHKLVLQKTSEYSMWYGASDSVIPE